MQLLVLYNLFTERMLFRKWPQIS